MFYRISHSWNIFKRSMTLLNREKKLLVFPIISFFTLMLLLSFIGLVSLPFGIDFFRENRELMQSEQEQLSFGAEIIVFLITFLFYLATMFVANFCNVAFFSEITRGLRDEQVFIGRGFSFALSRIKAIFLWSLLAATVGVLLKYFEEKLGLIGRIFIRLAGIVWAVASVFAIPILVCRDINNPIQVLKESGQAIKRTWGEMLTGYIGLSALNIFAFCIFLFSSLGILVISMAAGIPALFIVLFIPLIILYLICVYLISVAGEIYKAALYFYSCGNDVSALGYTEEDMSMPFKMKR